MGVKKKKKEQFCWQSLQDDDSQKLWEAAMLGEGKSGGLEREGGTWKTSKGKERVLRQTAREKVVTLLIRTRFQVFRD